MRLPFFQPGKERCNLKQIASFKKCCAFWPEYVLIFFESNRVPTLSLQKVPNKYYLFDINKKLKMVDLWGQIFGGYPPQRSTIFDLPFWNLVVWDDTCLQSLQILAALRHPLPTLKNVDFGGLAYIYIYDILMYRENVLQLHWMMLIWKYSSCIFTPHYVTLFKSLRHYVHLSH